MITGSVAGTSANYTITTGSGGVSGWLTPFNAGTGIAFSTTSGVNQVITGGSDYILVGAIFPSKATGAQPGLQTSKINAGAPSSSISSSFSLTLSELMYLQIHSLVL